MGAQNDLRHMIEINFKKRYPGLAIDVAVSAPEQGITALFGRSGAGKTSIIQAVAGAVRPDEGRIAIGDRIFFDSAQRVDLPIHERRVGYVFQDSRLFPHLNVRRNLLYGFSRASGEKRITVDAVVDLLGIGQLLDRRPHNLSGGERQRIAIGRALLSQPKLLLMDEPLSSLDPPRKAELLPYIEGLKHEFGLPILYISHAFNEVARIADHLIIVDGGRIVRSGPLLEVASEPELSPLIGRFEAGAILACNVLLHDAAFALSTLTFVGGQLRVPQVDLPVGSALRVRIRARDVAIALSPPVDVSISNQLPGTLVSMTVREGPYVDAAIDIGGQTIRALITKESADRLRLAPGRQVWALIKSVSFDGRSVGFKRRAAPISPQGDA